MGIVKTFNVAKPPRFWKPRRFLVFSDNYLSECLRFLANYDQRQKFITQKFNCVRSFIRCSQTQSIPSAASYPK